MITNKIIIELILSGLSANTIDVLANNCPKVRDRIQELIQQGIIRRSGNKYVIIKRSMQKEDDVYRFVVDDMIPMFKKKRPDVKVLAKETTKRLKKIMSEYNIPLNVVRLAVKLYLNNTPAKYIRYPHYFVYKRKGNEIHSDLLNMIDLIRTNTNENRDIRFEL